MCTTEISTEHTDEAPQTKTQLAWTLYLTISAARMSTTTEILFIAGKSAFVTAAFHYMTMVPLWCLHMISDVCNVDDWSCLILCWCTLCCFALCWFLHYSCTGGSEDFKHNKVQQTIDFNRQNKGGLNVSTLETLLWHLVTASNTNLFNTKLCSSFTTTNKTCQY